MSNGGTNGLATALALIGATGRADAAGSDEQDDLFDVDAAMPSMLPPAVPAKSGPKGGRPVGALNKSTEQWRQLFLSKFRHPMMVLGELTTRSPEQLARDLGLYMYHEGRPVQDADGRAVPATGEAARLQHAAAVALLPYLAQKLPMAVEVASPRRGVVLIGDLTQAMQAQTHDLALPLPPEENQEVSEADIVRPDDTQSDAEPKPVKQLGEFKE